MHDYAKMDRTLVALNKKLIKGNVTDISEDERQALLYTNARSVYKRFPIEYLESGSADSLKEKFKDVLFKAENFVQEQKLTDVTYTVDYGHIVVTGYKPISNQALLEMHKKFQKQRDKQTEKYRQSKAKNKSEALKEINRLKKKFKI